VPVCLALGKASHFDEYNLINFGFRAVVMHVFNQIEVTFGLKLENKFERTLKRT
jgi:hypothetical protein